MDERQRLIEALMAQDARTSAAARMMQSVRPEGGGQQGALTEFAHDVVIPKSPLDWASYALGGPLSRGMKAGLLAGAGIMESDEAEAGKAGRLRAAAGGSRERLARMLAMDQESRMARAREMGFRTDEPLYHGTNRAFESFDPARRGHTTKAESARLGVWLATDPELANSFAILSASELGYRGRPQVYPLYHRAQRPATLRLRGQESDREVAATIAQAWDDGFDAVKVFAPNASPTVIVKNENQLRSQFARFDPAKKDSTNLSAGLAGLGLFAPLAGSPLIEAARRQPTQ
jgi:ADP-Ribosyltransferase in polyvalent proteins